MATGTPASKVMTTSSGSRGTGPGPRCSRRCPRSGAFQMSSRKPVSTARPQTFWSIEYGFFLVVSIGRLCSSAKAIALSRVSARSRTGAMQLQVGREGGDADLEADLVVALAGAAVGDGGGAVLAGGRDEVLDDDRPGQRRDQRVAVHVEGVGLQRRAGSTRRRTRRVASATYGLDGAAVEGALADDLQVLAALADVDGDGDDLGAGGLGDPADGDGGVQAAGVGEDDALGHGFLLGVVRAVWGMVVGSGAQSRLSAMARGRAGQCPCRPRRRS